jgi:ribonuclease HI
MSDTDIIAVYCDGGCIKKNPSTIGITWAFTAINAAQEQVIKRGGVVPYTNKPLTNNHAEQIAIVLALEAMPEGWSGHVYSDSRCALGRVFRAWSTHNLSQDIIDRSKAALPRLGRVGYTLLKGHPTPEWLERGYSDVLSDFNTNGNGVEYLPVSQFNVWADKECGRQARTYLNKQMLKKIEVITPALPVSESVEFVDDFVLGEI